MNATAQTEQTAAILPITRKPNEWLDAKQIRQLLKVNLGLNARQVTVSKGHSQRYMTLTIRDASVSLAKVQAFAAALDTWEMDMTDYVTGQSLTVETSQEVDDMHAAPFMAKATELAALVETMEEIDSLCLDDVYQGLRFWKDRGEVYFSLGDRRRPYRRSYEIRQDWAIRALALDMARLTA